jgi:hypothetical protein
MSYRIPRYLFDIYNFMAAIYMRVRKTAKGYYQLRRVCLSLCLSA